MTTNLLRIDLTNRSRFFVNHPVAPLLEGHEGERIFPGFQLFFFVCFVVPYVDFEMNPTGRSLSARSTVALKKEHIGREVALLFEQNDVRKPIVIGLMHVPERSIEVAVDGEIQEVSAENELLLRCGKSSILLRKDGKIVIKGENILSRARMTNKVKGGSVQLN